MAPGHPASGLIRLDLVRRGVEAVAAWRRKITPSTGIK
jgi:hypothetical protein